MRTVAQGDASQAGALGDGALQPLYLRVYEQLADQIADHTLTPGSRLPSEREMCSALGVSRLTLRRALTMLADDGMVVSSQGRGWFVPSRQISEQPGALQSFTELARERGFRPGARVLLAHRRGSTLDEAETFQIAPGTELFELQRLRSLDELPVALHDTIVPVAVCPGIDANDFANASVYGVLQDAGVAAGRASVSIEAAAAGADEAALLGIAEGDPLLVVTMQTFDANGRPVEFGHLRYRADRYRFRTVLTRRETLGTQDR